MIWLGVGAVALAAAVYYPYSAAGRQAANMRLAEQHIRVLAPQLSGDTRFARLKLFPHSAHGGSLGIAGAVATDSDATDLKSIVAQSNPPVQVEYAIGIDARSVAPPTASRPTTARAQP
jgi:hypothetical protein